jgi:hypothetical protein
MNRQRLIIRISRDSILLSTTEGQEVRFERYPLNSGVSQATNMREALKAVPILQDEYNKVQVMMDSAVLITPVSLFREEDKEQLYSHAFTRQESQLVMHSILPDLNVVTVFAVQKDLHQVLHERFPQVTYRPLMSGVWRHMYQKSFTGQHQKLYGYFHDKKLEVFSFGPNRFKFQNVYNVGTTDDAVYFLLSVWKLLGLNPQSDELHIAGQMTDKEQLKERLLEFIKRVFMSNPSGEFNRAPVTQIEGMPYDMMLMYLMRS